MISKTYTAIFGLLGVLIVSLAVFGSFALASTPTPAGAVNISVIDYGSATETTATTVNASYGNISRLDLTANASTKRWHGYFGNITASLKLGNGSAVFYDFGGAQINTVFATSTNSFAWGQLVAATASNVDTAWGYTTNAADNASKVFSGSGTVENIASVPTVTTVGSFVTGAFADSTPTTRGDFAFGAVVYNPAKTGFDSSATYSYQLMVPTGVQNSQQYYLYMSLK